MFGSHALETAIGMAFLFLGVSLIVTAIQEAVASALKLRASTLVSGLKSMMVEGQNGVEFYNSLIKHPAVTPTGGTPSYISAEQFSTAALHVLNVTGQIPAAAVSLQTAVQGMKDSPFKKVMASLLREGETGLDDFETRLQHWFDQSMDRVSGIYKRFSQYISLAIGAVLSFVFQIDAIAIVRGLWSEPDCCGTLTAAAEKAVANESSAMSGLAQFDLTPIWVQWAPSHTPPGDVTTWIIGCAITTIAVSLGAPFWFDTLQNFVSLRGTGPEPQSSSSPAKN
jgi:hypothetical protein